MSASSSRNGKPLVSFHWHDSALATAQRGGKPESVTSHDAAGESEQRTLMTGMRYEIAATHSDPRAFFDRMVHQYGLKLKRRA